MKLIITNIFRIEAVLMLTSFIIFFILFEKTGILRIVFTKSEQQTTSKVSSEQDSLNKKEYVLQLLDSRQTKPSRTPAEWVRFTSSLDYWFRKAPEDCVATLQSRGNYWILNKVVPALANMSDSLLIKLAANTQDSSSQFGFYNELWKRKCSGSIEDCVSLIAAMPARYRYLFQPKLAKLWVDRRGTQALTEIAANPVVIKAIFDQAFSLCAKNDAEKTLLYVRGANEDDLTTRFGRRFSKMSLICEVTNNLSPKRGVEVLSSMSPNIVRDSRLQVAVLRAIEDEPQLASSFMAQSTDFVPAVMIAARRVAEQDPRQAAQMVNLAPGEKMRTSAALRTVMEIDRAKAKTFVENLDEPITKTAAMAALTRRFPDIK